MRLILYEAQYLSAYLPLFQNLGLSHIEIRQHFFLTIYEIPRESSKTRGHQRSRCSGAQCRFIMFSNYFKLLCSL